MKIIVVIPTYNEARNIKPLLESILMQSIPNATLSVLVVDDSSPDGTGDIVKGMKKHNHSIHIITGKKQGLGNAYKRGFTYATTKLKADVIIEMDADHSHNPSDIPRMVAQIQAGYDLVIGSRYIPGGTIPSDWSMMRKLNSKVGNVLARLVLNVSDIRDTTGGFRAISTSLLKKIHVNTLPGEGYAFQVSLLSRAVTCSARILEIPINFRDRREGESKIRLNDVIEFIYLIAFLRFPYIKDFMYFGGLMLTGFVLGIFYLLGLSSGMVTLSTLFLFSIVCLAIAMIIQSAFAIYLMVYAWDQPTEDSSAQHFIDPQTTFTLLIPARFEKRVIAQTLDAIANLNYPKSLYEVLVICRSDDEETISTVNTKLHDLSLPSFRLIEFSGYPINKPHSLNQGLSAARNNVIGVFDAEDEPHPDILQIMNTAFTKEKSDAIQGGVQLMNVSDSWYSTFNVLEYFFWFKSSLHYFARQGFIPLGGNTVFFKRSVLNRLGGWDEDCLTEDAEIGVRLSAASAKIKVLYDAQYVTKEETPSTLSSFIKQRTRWNQGFLQVLFKGKWTTVPGLFKKILAIYILLWPLVQAFFFLYIPVSVAMTLFMKLPVAITMLTMVPIYLLGIHFITQMIGLYEFHKAFGTGFSYTVLLRSFVTFYLYQVLLGISAVRACIRYIQHNSVWEKTTHLNTHREFDPFTISYLPLSKNNYETPLP